MQKIVMIEAKEESLTKSPKWAEVQELLGDGWKVNQMTSYAQPVSAAKGPKNTDFVTEVRNAYYGVVVVLEKDDASEYKANYKNLKNK